MQSQISFKTQLISFQSWNSIIDTSQLMMRLTSFRWMLKSLTLMEWSETKWLSSNSMSCSVQKVISSKWAMMNLWRKNLHYRSFLRESNWYQMPSHINGKHFQSQLLKTCLQNLWMKTTTLIGNISELISVFTKLQKPTQQKIKEISLTLNSMPTLRI